MTTHINDAQFLFYGGNPVAQINIETIEVLRAGSPITQEPVALDTAIQLSFGAPQSVSEFDLDALGNLTCKVADEYSLWLRVQFGRTGTPGEAIVLMRALLNGTQAGASVFTRLDDASTVVPGTFQGVINLTAGDVITVEVARDSAGINEGGVFAFAPTIAGWNDAPSCQVIFNRIVGST